MEGKPEKLVNISISGHECSSIESAMANSIWHKASAWYWSKPNSHTLTIFVYMAFFCTITLWHVGILETIRKKQASSYGPHTLPITQPTKSEGNLLNRTMLGCDGVWIRIWMLSESNNFWQIWNPMDLQNHLSRIQIYLSLHKALIYHSSSPMF